MVAAASGNEGFYIDLFDNSLNHPTAVLRQSSISTMRVEHDSAGMLVVNLPPNSCRSLQFEFLGAHSVPNVRKSSKLRMKSLVEDSSENSKKEHVNDDACVRETHALLREVHRAISDEQVCSSFLSRTHMDTCRHDHTLIINVFLECTEHLLAYLIPGVRIGKS